VIRALGAAAAVAWAFPAPAPHLPALCGPLGIERRIAAPGAALTFDDGPHPEGTPSVLEALADAGARATFFVVGEQVDRRPALVAEIAAAGHAIGIHGYRHTLLLRRSPHAVADDLERCAAAIEHAAGVVPELHRAPYGVYSSAALALVRGRGWRPVLWSTWGRDWRARATPESVAAEAGGPAGSGDVVLLHDADFYSDPGSWRTTAAAVPRILAALGERGVPTVTL
jgi:peptidoglycan/xylan/chitin deacetylase (PgdA/CDA1 family)